MDASAPIDASADASADGCPFAFPGRVRKRLPVPMDSSADECLAIWSADDAQWCVDTVFAVVAAMGLLLQLIHILLSTC